MENSRVSKDSSEDQGLQPVRTVNDVTPTMAESQNQAGIASTPTPTESVAVPESAVEQTGVVAEPQTSQGLASSNAPSESTDSSNRVEQVQPASHQTGHKAPMGAVIAAIVVALLLVVAAIFAYIQTNDSDGAATNNVTGSKKSQATATDTPATKVTDNDVSSLADEAEKAVNDLDDSSDYNSNTLSDTSLGL